MDARLAAALEAVALRLAEHDVPFLLGGSALLHAVGLDVEVRDIDLMLREQDRRRFEAAVAGVPLCAPELWWAVYLRCKPEKARALEPLVPAAARTRAAAELLVAASYDAVAERYRDAVDRTDGDPREGMLEAFARRLPAGAAVLDLGCGSGHAGTERLAERFAVTGVDVSARQLELARERLPGVTLLHAGMTELDLPPAGFDGVVALYSLVHVPRERHGALFEAVARWLRPGGLFLASLGARDNPGQVEEDWLGAPMFFSHHDAAGNRRALRRAGFELVVDEVIAMREGDGREAAFHWVLASTAVSRRSPG